MFGLFNKKKVEPEKFNVGKAVAVVHMKSGNERTITKVGSTFQTGSFGEFVYSGQDKLKEYLNTKNTLLCDDNGKYFPVSDIREIVVKIEDYFV